MRERYRPLADRWDVWRTRLRETLAHYTPHTLTYYPFEVLASMVGLLVGLPLLLGLAAPTSLVLLLPDAVYWLYAVMVSVGAGTTAVGLHARNSLVLASGLQLLGGSYLVYALATVAISGFSVAWLVFGAFSTLGLLCVVRASHFRRLLDIQKGATNIERTSP